MKTRLTIFLLFLACFSVKSAEQVEMLLTVTNAPVTGDELTIIGATRTWTNAHSATTILTNYTSIEINNSATNLYFNLSAFTLASPRPVIIQSDTNVLRFIFAVGQTVTASESGNWSDITFTTNTITAATTVRVPITVESASNRIHIASRLVESLAYATNAALYSWTALSQLAGLTNNNVFTGTNSLTAGGWNGGSISNLVTLSGALGALTNGYSTNLITDGQIATNLTTHGITSPGAGSSSEKLGAGSSAAGDYSLAVGNAATASGLYSISVGQVSVASGVASISLGTGAESGFGNDIAIGTGAAANATNSIAIGTSANVSTGRANSMAIGSGVTASGTNEIKLGASTHTVNITGMLMAATTTNSTFTGTNHIHGAISLNRRSDATQPTGHNIITNGSFDNLVWLTAPSGGSTNVGFTDGWDGRIMRYVKYNGGYNMGIANESGLASAERRVLTGTGSDVTITNSPGFFDLQYDATLSRWILLGHSQ